MRWPERRKEGVMVPVRKTGQGDKVEDYRVVTIMPTLYKIFAAVLKGRLREEVEGAGVLPERQTRFRKGRGTMDNVYVLNYIMNRQLQRKGGRWLRCCGFVCGFRLGGQGGVGEGNEREGSKGGAVGDGGGDLERKEEGKSGG